MYGPIQRNIYQCTNLPNERQVLEKKKKYWIVISKGWPEGTANVSRANLEQITVIIAGAMPA